MKIEYYHKNIDHLTDPSKNFISEKLSVFEEICERPQIRIELDKTKAGYFHMHVRLDDDGTAYYAEAEYGAIESCIEAVRNELMAQITKHKDKKRDLDRRTGRSLKKKLTIDDKARL